MTTNSESANDNIKRIALGALGFFIFIALYVNEFSWLANTFHRNTLIIVGLLIGVVAGAGVGYKLQMKSLEMIEKFQICLGAMILGAIVMPLIFSLTNRCLSFSGVQKETVEFFKNEAFNESRFGHIPQEKPDGYYAFVVRNGDVHRLTTRSPIYVESQKGEKVLLPIKKGLWGFEIAYPHQLHE